MSLGLSNKIENIQRRAAMICTGAISRTETPKLLADVGWTSLKERRTKFKLIYFYKIYINANPIYLNGDLHALLPNRGFRQTRSSEVGMLNISFCRTNKFKNSFFPSTISICNKLITDIRLYDSLNKLKKFLATKFEIDNRYFNYNLMIGSTDKIVTQMRLGLSSLRDHLFRYCLTDNPFCQSCMEVIETSAHFLFECKAYDAARVHFLHELSSYPDTCHPSMLIRRMN